MPVKIITTCAPFIGEKGLHQRMAMSSWSNQAFKAIVLGDEIGVKQECERYNFTHIPEVQTAHQALGLDHHSIMLRDGLQKALEFIDKIDIVVWLNSDIILLSRLREVLYPLRGPKGDSYSAWARRWDLDWNGEGGMKVHDYCGIDLFFWTSDLFRKTVKDLPDFVVDAWSTDHYFARYMKTLSPNYYELTNRIKGLHFNHGTGAQLKGDWNKCASHNKKLLNNSFSGVDPKPIMLKDY